MLSLLQKWDRNKWRTGTCWTGLAALGDEAVFMPETWSWNKWTNKNVVSLLGRPPAEDTTDLPLFVDPDPVICWLMSWRGLWVTPAFPLLQPPALSWPFTVCCSISPSLPHHPTTDFPTVFPRFNLEIFHNERINLNQILAPYSSQLAVKFNVFGGLERQECLQFKATCPAVDRCQIHLFDLLFCTWG